ncbi:MAG: TraB/GumN family protein, partial [Alteraurantiacibacter sp.]
IYLFGTVHVLPEGLEWLQPTVADALAESDQFVSEIDTSAIPDFDPASGQAPPPEIIAIAQMQMQLAALEGDKTLRELMTEEDRAEYEAAMEELGLPANAFDSFEPWFASINLMQLAMMKAGYDPQNGVELMLDDMIEGKERSAFETIEQQMGFFDSMPMQSQLDFLDQGIEEWDDMEAVDGVFQQMVAEWMAGDPDGLAQVINEQMDDPVVYDILLSQRNSAWAAWLDDRMDQPGTVFVAVGAGHLGGENSVQDYLTERGIAVERVAY